MGAEQIHYCMHAATQEHQKQGYTTATSHPTIATMNTTATQHMETQAGRRQSRNRRHHSDSFSSLSDDMLKQPVQTDKDENNGASSESLFVHVCAAMVQLVGDCVLTLV